MWKISIALLGLAVLPATSRGVDKKRLQELLYLPTIKLKTTFQFDADCGLLLEGLKRDYSGEIAQLRKGMVGDTRDAARYQRLAKLYSMMDADAEADKAFAQSEKLYREAIKQSPSDGALHSALGVLLTDFDHDREGELLLRRAVALAPRNCQCWLNLGCWLEKSALCLSDQSEHGSGALTKPTGVVQAANRPPDMKAKAKDLLNEASACFNTAVARSAGQARPYFERCCFRMNEARIIANLHIPADETELATVSERQFFDDWRNPTELEPTNVVYAANAVMMEVLVSHLNFEDGDGWKRLPVDVQRRLTGYLKRLENLTRSDDRGTAIGAHLLLAVTGIVLYGDRANSERHCRTALALDPAQDASWEVLMGTLEGEAFLSAALDWLKRSESPRKHYLVAKAYGELKRWQKAEEHIRIVLQSQPNDARANLAMGVLLMKRSVDASTLAQASTYLEKAEKLIDDGSPEDLRLDSDFTIGIYRALRGEIERACCLFAEVMRKDSKRKTAREALEALRR